MMSRRLFVLLFILVAIAGLYLVPQDSPPGVQTGPVAVMSPPPAASPLLGQETYAQLLERPLFDPSRRVAAVMPEAQPADRSRIEGWKLVGVFVGIGAMIKQADENVRFLRLNDQIDGVTLVLVDGEGAGFDWGGGMQRLNLQKPPSILKPAQ